jgi:hypothetical protein
LGANEITLTYNEVEHTTDFGDGRVHETFTQTGTFVAVPVDDPSLPTYTGKFTIWGGFNANGKTVNGTFTITVHGTGSDGSAFKVHETDRPLQHHAHRGGVLLHQLPRLSLSRPATLAPGVAGGHFSFAPAAGPPTPSVPFVLPGTCTKAAAGQRTVSARG